MSRIRADQLVNRAGSGGPKFPHGVAEGFSVSGVVTATSFRGDGSQLTGIDASSLKDGSNVKVQATATGATVTGDISATNASFSGNLTVQGTTTTIDTVVSAVDSLQVDGNVGIGTTNATSILDVRNGIIVKDQDTSQNAANPGLQLKHNGTIYGSWRHDGRLEIGGQDANATIRLNPNGTVGIGTDNPGDKLDVQNAGNCFVNIKSTDNSGRIALGAHTNENRIKSADSGNGAKALKIFTGTSSDTGITINASNNIGINSTAPAGALDVGGNVFPAADNTHDLGSASKRWANIYTGDLNLSNEGSANDVDGTWGQYTIQEGEDDLFLINRRTGKKYKFNLTEVD